MNSLFKTVTGTQVDDHQVIAFQDSKTVTQTIFIQDLELEMSIGVFDDEKKQKQRVLINLELEVTPTANWQEDNISNVVSYADVIDMIEDIVTKNNHIHLVETFAEMIIEECFKIAKVTAAKISVSKPDIIANTASVGVIMEKRKS